MPPIAGAGSELARRLDVWNALTALTLSGSSLLAGIAAALTLFAGFAFTLLVASLVWELPSRGWWLAGLCTLYVAAAVTAGSMLARRLRTWRPLGETQTQLQQDYQCLSQLIKSNAP